MSNSHMLKGIEAYNQQKPDNDIDLINEVRACMLSAGLGQRITAFDQDRFILEASGKESSVQRYLLNRYWTNQLLHAQRVSIEERYCLIPDGCVQDWLDLFKARVLPFIISNDLPMAA